MLFPSLAVLFLSGLAHAAGALTIPPNQIAYMQFPETMLSNQYVSERDYFNGFRHWWREYCLNLCGHEKGIGYSTHHMMSAVPLRMPNTAAVSCYCCIKDSSGKCYDTTNPYSASQPYGPTGVVWMTNNTVAKMGMQKAKPIAVSTIAAYPPVVLEVNTAVPTPGKTITFHWEGPKSEVGGTYYAYFIAEDGTTIVKALSNNGCTLPPNMYGKVKVTVSAQKDPKASSLYIVARTTLNIAKPSRKRSMHVHRKRQS